MNQNETRTLWISVGAALFAVFLLWSYTQEKSAELTKKFGAKQRVVIATKDINEFETIMEDMLEVVERPVDFIEPSALSEPEKAVGLLSLAPLKKGEQLLSTKLTQPGPVSGLSLQVSPSKRAVAIPVNEINGVSKLIKPGDRIDIVAALDVGKGVEQKREVKTLMQDVTVLATGARLVNELPIMAERMGKDLYLRNLREDMGFTAITIEASPEEAQDLIYILSTSPGSIYLTLRHPTDQTKKRMPETTIESLLGRVSKAMIPPPIPRVPAAEPPPKPVKPKRKGPFIDM